MCVCMCVCACVRERRGGGERGEGECVKIFKTEGEHYHSMINCVFAILKHTYMYKYFVGEYVISIVLCS